MCYPLLTTSAQLCFSGGLHVAYVAAELRWERLVGALGAPAALLHSASAPVCQGSALCALLYAALVCMDVAAEELSPARGATSAL